MPLLHLRWFSQILQKQVETHVIYPDCAPPPHPVLYLLHGLSDDSSNWTRWTRIEQHAQPHPMVIVMPDGFRGFYTNNEQGARYGDYIAVELPSVIERMFNVRADRASRAIGGLSMGGYGAMRIALENPERFCSVHSHSGALTYGTTKQFAEFERQDWRPPGFLPEMRRVFGPDPDGTAHDLFALLRRARKSRLMPRIRIDCGREDFLLEANRQFVAELKSLRVPHIYLEEDGEHNWDYWERNIAGALEFHAKNFAAGLKAPKAGKSPGRRQRS